MALNFPSSPTTGQTYTANGQTWTFNGVGWASGYQSSSYVRLQFTATAGQTTFTISNGYQRNLVDVYQNGVKLVNGSDVDVSTGTAVVLATGASLGDIIEVIGLASVANIPVAAVTPAGVLVPYAGINAPTGWLFCYGQAISRTVYSDLFSALSTTHGVGDGTTTFNIPDMRGRTSVGKDDMGGTAANRITSAGSGITGTTLGANGGSETQTLTINQIPAHTHTLGATSSSAVGAGAGNGIWNNGSGLSTGSNGGGLPHNNTQPSIILNHIIKY
jgi:microcystin-dependent protein